MTIAAPVELHDIPIKDIWVPPDRQRPLDQEHIRLLMFLIKTNNKLRRHHIYLSPTKVQVGDRLMWRLVFGNHRLESCRRLGWETIPSAFTESDDPAVLADEEFLENCHRGLTDEENEKQLTEFRKRHGITQQDLAAHFGGQSKVSKSEIAYKAHQANPEKYRGMSTNEVYKTLLKENNRRRGIAGIDIPDDAPAQHYDFHEWARTYTGPKFNVIHCDFPYGINSHNSGQNPSGYDDSRGVYLDLCNTLSEHLDNFCADDAHMFFWCSSSAPLLSIAWEFLSVPGFGFTFDDVPLVWHKGGNQGIVPDSERRPRRMYEMCFFWWRGRAKRIPGIEFHNIVDADPTPNRQHAHEKSVVMLKKFFKPVVDGHSLVFDPTCGSGTALLAAKELGARYVFGIDKDAANVKTALRLLEPPEDIDLDDLGLGLAAAQ